jgi:hypothetical protein
MVSRRVERAVQIGYTDAMETIALALLILAIGVVGPAYLLARRIGLVVPLAFIASYVLAVGALTFISVVVFGMIDVKFRQALLSAWLKISWPLATVLYVPSVVFALLACWFSRPSTWRDAAVLLGMYLFLILVAVGAALAFHLHAGFWFQVALPGTVFFAMALVKRVAQGRRHWLSLTHDVPSQSATSTDG